MASSYVSQEQNAPSEQALVQVLQRLTDDVKLPLMYIARQAELAHAQESVSVAVLKQMQQQADAAIRLLDSYALGIDMLQTNSLIALEPVSISSVLYDVAHAMDALAAQQDCALELRLDGRYGQAMAHPAALRAGLMCMLYTLIHETATSRNQSQPARIILAGTKQTGSLIAGVYSKSLLQPLTMRAVQTHAQQPLPDQFAGGASGLLLADQLFGAMGSALEPRRYRGLYGAGLRLTQSRQLSIV